MRASPASFPEFPHDGQVGQENDIARTVDAAGAAGGGGRRDRRGGDGAGVRATGDRDDPAPRPRPDRNRPAVDVRDATARPERGRRLGTPLQDLRGTITPADLHFERHHAGVPEIDPARYELLIHGLVERPRVFSLADLKRFPSTSRICFLECSGNLRRGGPDTLPQTVCGLTSQTEWTGVMLSTLLDEVGASADATWFLAEGQDAAVMTRSIPMEKAFDDAMLVYAQERRRADARQRIPGTAAAAGLGRQLQREVAATDRAGRPAVHDAGRNIEIHRPTG